MNKIFNALAITFGLLVFVGATVGIINDAFVIGSNAPAINGAMRYSGGDLEVYKEGSWTTMTGGGVEINMAALTHDGTTTDSNSGGQFDLVKLDNNAYTLGTALTVDTTNSQILVNTPGTYLVTYRAGSDGNTQGCRFWAWWCVSGTDCSDATVDAMVDCGVLFTPPIYGYYYGDGTTSVSLPDYIDGGSVCLGFRSFSDVQTCVVDLENTYLSLEKID